MPTYKFKNLKTGVVYEDFMSINPKTITADTLAITALELMEKHNITSLFVYSSDELKKPDGIIHIHDILKTGILDLHLMLPQVILVLQ